MSDDKDIGGDVSRSCPECERLARENDALRAEVARLRQDAQRMAAALNAVDNVPQMLRPAGRA